MIKRLIAALVMILIPTAAFANSYDDAMKTVRVLSGSSYVRLLPFGKSHANRTIPAFAISDFSSDCRDKTRVFICAGQHGDELDPVKSVLSFCKSLTSGAHPDLLQQCVIIVVPAANPDGLAASRRLNAVDVDINRDWIDLTTCETRFVDGIITKWKPHLLIDVHQWNEPSFTPENSIEIPSCSVGSHRDAMIAAAHRASDSSSLNMIEVRSTSKKSLFHRHYATLGFAAFLLETRDGESYASRDKVYKSAILSLIGSVADKTGARYVMSPAAMDFKPASVAAYLAPATGENQAASFYKTGILTIVCIILACLMRPFRKSEKTDWSRRYILCEVEPGIPMGRLAHKHSSCPITSRSWVNRRLRAKYAPVEEKKNEPEDEDSVKENFAPAANLVALLKETAGSIR